MFMGAQVDILQLLVSGHIHFSRIEVGSLQFIFNEN
jgi:hypothetical protein